MYFISVSDIVTVYKGYLKTQNSVKMYSDDDIYEDEYSGYGHTGDPVQDRLDYAVPDQVKKFLQYFQDMIKEGNVYEVNSLYENSFPKLTEQYFKVLKF